MTAQTMLEFDRTPAVAPAYLRALTAFGGGLSEGETIPRIESHITGLRADRGRLRGYRRVCGFADEDNLPVTYPHIMAFPVHMAVMTHHDFPLKLLGLVHVRNKITQHRAIGVEETLDLQVHVDGHRDVYNGVEFDLATAFSDREGNRVWDSHSTMLSRGKGSGKRPAKKRNRQDEALEFGRYATWDVPAGIGRSYARVAGDINPIHLSALSAKLFGFPRAIAHGMWLKARTAAELQDQLRGDDYTIEVAFKRPVLLPSSVMLKYNPGDRGTDFILMDPDGQTPHMIGGIAYLSGQ